MTIYDRLVAKLKRRKRVEARQKRVQSIFNDMDGSELEEVVGWLLEDDDSLPHLERALKECGYREAE